MKQLYSLIKGKEENEIRKIFSPFFNYLINYYELDIIDKDKKIKIAHEKETFTDKLNIISEYLRMLFDHFGNLEEIFKNNKIKEEYKNKYDTNNIYIKSFNGDEYEKDILDIFYILTGNLPLFSNIFIFKEDSVEEEYIPFLYKVLKINVNCLFILILKECKNDNEDNILKKINEILATNKTNLFIILYSRNNISKIKKYLNEYKNLNNG